MTKTKRDLGLNAEESFHRHYATIWGHDRWYTSLYPRLCQETRHAALVNRYAPQAGFWDSQNGLEKLIFPTPDSLKPAPAAELVCYAIRLHNPADDPDTGDGRSLPFPSRELRSQDLQTHWNLDAASVLVAHLLDVRPGQAVLDICAAPGGKSLALVQKLWPSLHADEPVDSANATGTLCSNELDPKRNRRLIENLNAYLHLQIFQDGRIRVTRADATSPSPLLPRNAFDAVLVDAPCSSERHIIHAHLRAKKSGRATAAEMASWRPSSSKRLVKTQVELVMTALRAVKIGGRVMYATCSIEMAENDGVVEKMLAMVEKENKKGAQWSVNLGFHDDHLGAQLEQWAERTKYGWVVLPDHPSNHGWGPMFFCSIAKTILGKT